MKMPGRYGNENNSYDYGFNGMRKDDEIHSKDGSSYDFGARQYDSRIGRWQSVDAMESKYVGHSPYNFVLNMPLNAIDPDGNDVIVLSASSGASGMGHSAVLVGNNKKGWTYVSKDGTGFSSGMSGDPTKNKVTEKFASLEDFLKSKRNNVEGKAYYDGAYLIKSEKSPLHKNRGGKLTSKEIDKKMIEAGEKQKNKKYNVLSSSCIDVSSDALDAGGFDPGFLSFWEAAKQFFTNQDLDNRLYKSERTGEIGQVERDPNDRVDDIKNNNEGEILSTQIDDSTKEKFKKDYQATETEGN